MDTRALRRFVLLLTVFLAFSLLFCGCGASGAGGGKNDEKEEETEELPPAEPAMGVGRVTSGGVVPREELILIDPGHGFDDPGNGDAAWSFWRDLQIRERDVTIVLARMLDEELQKRGFRTAMTHNADEIPSGYDYDWNYIFNPDERAAYINAVAPDYMVSVHVNSAENQSACGAIVFYNESSASKWNDWSKPAAECIAKNIDSFVEINASTKVENELTFAGASYAVTRDTHAAGCLIEIGYVSNSDDAQDMLNENWQRSMAEGIAEGIAEFFDTKAD